MVLNFMIESQNSRSRSIIHKECINKKIKERYEKIDKKKVIVEQNSQFKEQIYCTILTKSFL